jgi:hypothetical protein
MVTHECLDERLFAAGAVDFAVVFFVVLFLLGLLKC